MRSIVKRFDYDSNSDILYCTFRDKSNSYGDEDPDNIVVMRDIDTDIITGITILNFMTMYKNKDMRIKNVSEYIDIDSVIKDIFAI